MLEFEEDIKKCVETLEEGGTILYPTDTIWGLGCDATKDAAVEAIIKIKNRPEHKSFIVLVADIEMLLRYLINPIPDLEDFIAQQKGAATIIYENVSGIAKNALAADGSLGIRIPKDPFCQALLKRFQKPIISTSANLSGETTPSFYEEMSTQIKNRVDFTVHWRREDKEPQAPSSILKIAKDGTITKIR